MSKDNTFSGSILRIFEARAKPGCADSLAKKFATTSVDVVRNQPGNQGHFFSPRNVRYGGHIGSQMLAASISHDDPDIAARRFG
jgi:hypothetical protein